jgi:hypothetical protein
MNEFPNWINWVRNPIIMNLEDYVDSTQYVNQSPANVVNNTWNARFYRHQKSGLPLEYMHGDVNGECFILTNPQDIYPKKWTYSHDKIFNQLSCGKQSFRYAKNIIYNWADVNNHDFKIETISDIGLHPITINCNEMYQYYCNGVLHQDKANTPAIKMSSLTVKWNPKSICDKFGITYRPGPSLITFFGYREYWNHGKFIRCGWSSIDYKWPNGLHTMNSKPLGKWIVINVEANEYDKHPILRMLNNPEFKGDPLTNQFFTSTEYTQYVG